MSLKYDKNANPLFEIESHTGENIWREEHTEKEQRKSETEKRKKETLILFLWLIVAKTLVVNLTVFSNEDSVKECGLVYKPVCGSDGKTYHNRCSLDKQACKSNVTFVKKGPCKRWKRAVKSCGDLWAPICANNGNTYNSICALKMFNPNKKIKIDHIGPCSVNKCPNMCPEVFRPTCGMEDDVITLYYSECEMKREACKRNKKVIKVKKKKCKDLCIPNCPEAPLEKKVCGTNSVTYASLCHLTQEACTKRTNIEFKSQGPCDAKEETLPLIPPRFI